MAYSYVWPLTLPQNPLRSGYSETPGANILRTPMDAGPAKMRLRSRRPDSVAVTYVMEAAQLVTLETFCRDTIRGTARFGWKHPRTKQIVEARIVPDQEGSLYTITPAGGDLWHVALRIEVLP